MANSYDQSPIKVNFKRAHYDRPIQSDDSDVGDGIGFEDLPITDLDSLLNREL